MSGMNLNVGIRGLARGININSIEVPQSLRRRLKTGLDFFDSALGEGLVPSAVMMLTGTPGAGKTTMLLQLANSITAQGHICLYNTGEESLYQVKMTAERLKLKNGFVCGQDIMVNDLIDHADELRKANPGKQVFILLDSLNVMNDGKYKDGGTNSMTPVRVTEILTDWAKTNFTNVIFISQVNKSGEFVGKNTILHAIDVRGELYIDTDKKSETFGERLFEVTKNRFGPSGLCTVLGLNAGGLYERGSFGH